MWCLDPRTWEWNKVKKSGLPPGPRAGFSMCVHKKRALLFGGVVDMEMEGDLMMSLFLNEIYGFQLDNHRWYPLELRKEKATKDKLKKDSAERPNDTDLESKTRVAERQDIASSDEDENSDSDDAGMESDIKNVSVNLDRNLVVSQSGKASGPNKRFSVQNSVIPEASESEWIEASDNEDEDEDEDEDDSEDEESGSGDDSEESGDEDEYTEATNGAAKSLQMGDAVAIIKGEGKSLRRKEKRVRIEQIRASLGLSDSQRTPMVFG
ncbi:UNVERIFIED_CONTAM: hypothetical protein Slati_3409000 [Sesamum latifolium]|uniref:Uncharacterized protein n=1 Tax=Sesamum latifolium TaxID=2727402 RepID=A0AAW2UIH6_9LAMI